MFLVIDIGNTNTKLAWFKEGELPYKVNIVPNKSLNYSEEIKNYISEYHLHTKKAIISSVSSEEILVKTILKNFNISTLHFTYKSSLPINIKYETPDTLGSDRISLACGANTLYPNQNVLVISIGTCITYEFINNKNEYLGGAISPGINIRLKSLHAFTQKLPLITLQYEEKLPEVIAQNTHKNILSGVLNGVLFELKGNINWYSKNYPDLKIILTGGDVIYFENELKKHIFVVQNLVLVGLNKILQLNT